MTVYRFTDDNTLATASDYSAVVTLGDGNTVTLTSAAGPNGQIVADPNGGFDVQLSYTYREELSNATFGVAVTDQGGQTTGGGTSNFSVADAALHGGALTPPTAVEGVAFTNSTVYRFTDDNTLATASDYSAVVTLGDGNTVTLTSAAGPNGQIVADPNGGFDVQLSYTYREELSNATFGVAVTDQGGQTTGGGTSNFSVADAALHGGALTPPTAVEGVAFTNSTVYRFTDDNTLATASDYSAVVTLGDGNTVTLTSAAGPNGQIVADPNGGFDVQLSYTYREELSNATFGVAVTDQGGQTTGGGTSNFAVLTPVQAANPQIQLDATNTSTVTTHQGGQLFNSAQHQYITEPENASLDTAFNNVSNLTIEFTARETTQALDQNFASRWNYGSTGTIAVSAGNHYQQGQELTVWFAGPNSSVAAVVETVVPPSVLTQSRILRLFTTLEASRLTLTVWRSKRLSSRELCLPPCKPAQPRSMWAPGMVSGARPRRHGAEPADHHQWCAAAELSHDRD